MTYDPVRRSLLKVTAASVGIAPVLLRESLAQALDPEEAERVLYPAKGLPGGGQMEVRMMVESEHPDPDIVELGHLVKPFNLQSWYAEHSHVAEKNEKRAQAALAEGNKVTASEYFLRAAGFWRSAIIYLPEADDRMMKGYARLKETFDKAWTLVPPPFERVQIPYEGKILQGYFFPARAPQGRKAPVVFNYGGADGMLMGGRPDGGSGQYRARGISYLDVDGPGQGWALRMDKIYAVPDTERYAKAVVDYLVARSDVDADRIGIHGSSMGGYTAPRACTVEKRFKACAVWSGAYNLQQDIFDYYPPIQERLRWLIGAKDLSDGRKRMAEFTLQGNADKIECPLLVGYSIDDRVMDPRGALRLYKAAANAKPSQMLDGVGHGKRTWEQRSYIADWFAKQLGTA
jgi:dipeptidyl aminopeptidase/acylaminoacyl peptidase